MIKKTILTVFTGILLLSNVLALGVTAPYWDERPLIMSPGETKDIQFELQNMVGDSNATLRANLITGEEIAKLTDKELDYLVPFGTKDVKVNMQISIPFSAKQGDNYTIGVAFNTLTQTESGQFQLGSAFEKYFSVIVNEPEKQEKDSQLSYLLYLIIGIILIVLVVYLVRKRN